MLVTNGTRAVRGYDAATGSELWQLRGNSEIAVPTPFAANGLIFAASGYRPVQPIHAIRLNARGDLTPHANDEEESNPAADEQTDNCFGARVSVCSTAAGSSIRISNGVLEVRP